MKGTYLFLADGFEISEALTTVNMLRRGGVNVKTVSIYDDRIVTSSNRIPVVADMAFGEFRASTSFGPCLPTDVMIFPGGMPGSANLAAFKKLMDIMVQHYEEGGTAIATISADEKMSVTISVDESDILSLALGQSVSVSVASVSEENFTGTLTQINRTSSSSGTYSAVIELEKAEGMLSGMTATASVQIEGVENAILIPIEALHLTSDGAYVYTSYSEEYQEYGGRVDVVTGLENSTYVEIKSGLSVGDTVYYTESQSSFGGFGGMSGMGGFPSGMGGMSEMPNFGGDMPSFGGSGGGGRPSFNGGQMPGGLGG